MAGKHFDLPRSTVKLLFIGLLCSLVPAALGNLRTDNKLEQKAEQKAEDIHVVDSLNLLLFTCLLIITVITIWIFKHRRFRFLHETGVTLIFGLIVGLIIRVSSSRSAVESLEVVPSDEAAAIREAPNFLRLQISTNETTGIFHYKLEDRFLGNNSETKELMEEKATFSPEIFFNILLPPIIFNAGYSLKRKHFFRNIGTIMAFAFLGTTISCIVVGYIMFGVAKLVGLSLSLQETLFFGALISATDPVTILAIFEDLHVDVDLFALVFGESALNDAVAIILSTTIEKFLPDEAAAGFNFASFAHALGEFLKVFVGSWILGSLIGCICAIITKFTKLADYPLLETSLFLLMSYLSFLAAEAAQMTGIVAVLFCGICQAHYTFNNLSEESQIRTKQFFEALNFLSENFIFTYIGVTLFTSESHNFNPWFIIGSFVAILVGRMAHLYPFTFILNLRRKPKLQWRHIHMMLFAGLRGAIAFALAIRNTATDARQIIYTTTSLIVIFTVIFNGGFCFQMIEWLKIRHGAEADTELTPQFQPVSTEEPSVGDGEAGESSSVNNKPHNPWDKSFLPRKWYNLDAKFMKPLLTHSRPSLMESMPECCMPLARILTTTKQMQQPDRRKSQCDMDLVDDVVFDQEANNSAPPAMSRSDSGDASAGGDLGMGKAIRIRMNNGSAGEPV